jgi:hypothetical protein
VSASRILAERIARVGDLDGDGFDDWLFGQPRAAFAGLDAGAVRIYSSKSGRLLHTGAGLVGTGAGDHRGETVLGLGDLDGDGRREWLVSSPGSDAAFADAGRVEIHSGRLRYPKHAGFFSTQVSYSQYKTPFCELDDIDFDGTPDFAYARDAQHIDVLSGSSLKVLWTHTVQIAGTLPTKPDLHLARIEDVDGDRFADLAVGNPREPQGAGAVELLSGRTGARLWIARSAIGGTQHGEWVSSFGDLDRDGVPDVLTTSVGLQSQPRGRAQRQDGSDDPAVSQLLGPGERSRPRRPRCRARSLLHDSGERRGIALGREWAAALEHVDDGGGRPGPIASGDLNGDGHADMLFRINGVVRAWSGRDGAPLWRFVGADWERNGIPPHGPPRHQQRRGGGDPGLLRRSAQSLEPRQPRGAPRRPQRKDRSRSSKTAIPIWASTARRWAYVGQNAAGEAFAVIATTEASGPGMQLVRLPAPALLGADRSVLRRGPGGSQRLAIQAGARSAGAPYLIVGSLSGILPGLPLGGGARLPLNYDFYTDMSVLLANVGPFAQSVGLLDSEGRAIAQWRMLPSFPLSASGLHLHHAALIFGPPSLQASQAVGLQLLR